MRPSRAHKGDTLTLTTVYTILTPEQQALPVTITREIFFQGKVLGQTKNQAFVEQFLTEARNAGRRPGEKQTSTLRGRGQYKNYNQSDGRKSTSHIDHIGQIIGR